MSEDYILIGGGLLIALVIMHGIWQAWRARQDPLPLDLASEVPDEGFDLEELGPDFPNGGARVVPRIERRDDTAPTQRPLGFEAAVPVLMEVVDEEATAAESIDVAEPGVASDARNGSASTDGNLQGSRNAPIVADASDAIVPSRNSRNARKEQRTAAREPDAPNGDAAGQAGENEILAINVLARGSRRFSGSELWAAFQRNGLTFGDMNIFHRLSPITRTPQYSVANAIEPGTFDLSGIETMETPGACFFLRLPGPSEPAAVFDDMLRVARDVGKSLDGDLKDEHFSVLTGQTEEHYRQRIAEFSRKRMSRRY